MNLVKRCPRRNLRRPRFDLERRARAPAASPRRLPLLLRRSGYLRRRGGVFARLFVAAAWAAIASAAFDACGGLGRWQEQQQQRQRQRNRGRTGRRWHIGGSWRREATRRGFTTPVKSVPLGRLHRQPGERRDWFRDHETDSRTPQPQQRQQQPPLSSHESPRPLSGEKSTLPGDRSSVGGDVGGNKQNSSGSATTPGHNLSKFGDKALGLFNMKAPLSKEAMKKGCTLCKKPFSMISRRPHPCRACGAYFCNPCSSHRHAVPPGEVPERVCDRCFVKLMDEAEAARSDAPSGGDAHDAAEDGAAQKTPYELLEADPAFEKYFRMLKMGVRREAVSQKMLADDVSPATVELFNRRSSSSLSSKKGGKARRRASANPLGAAAASSQLRQVHWNTLDEETAARSVFGQQSRIASAVPAGVNTDEQLRLRAMFGTSGDGGNSSGGKSGGVPGGAAAVATATASADAAAKKQRKKKKTTIWTTAGRTTCQL